MINLIINRNNNSINRNKDIVYTNFTLETPN